VLIEHSPHWVPPRVVQDAMPGLARIHLRACLGTLPSSSSAHHVTCSSSIAPDRMNFISARGEYPESSIAPFWSVAAGTRGYRSRR